MKRFIKRYLCAIIIVLTVVLSAQVLNLSGREMVNPFVTKVQAASIVKSWSIKSIEKLSQTDAQIKARVNFNKSVKCTQAGFYFGTDKNNLKKNAKYDSINYTGTYLDMWFLMSKYGQKLKSNTTYYYKFYVIAGGATYYSSVQSFKTKSYVKSWDIKSIEKLSQTDAQIKARVNFNKSVKCTQAGFYFGTDKNNLKKNAKYDSINYTGTYLDMWFLMSKYGQKLNPGTTYYYKFYVIAEGKEYCSEIKNFKTKTAPASVLSWFTNASGIGEKKAKIEANASTSKTVAVTESGFYIGTDSDNMKKYTEKFSEIYSDTNIPFSFDTSKYLTLTPGTEYFYKVYFIADGKTYFSPVKSFKTKAPSPAFNVTWNYEDVTNLSVNDAQIKATVKLSKSTKINQAGFYIGTSKDNLKKNSKPDVVNKSYKSLPMWYLMSKYQGKLNENTTYYYKFYVIAEGKEYCSAIKSFKTKAPSSALNVTWKYEDVSQLSSSDARIKATVNFKKSVKISKTGFYIGTSKDNLKKNNKPDVVNKSYKSLPMWYLMSKYQGKLNENTTYYYKFYVIAEGKEYCSAIKKFKTKTAPASVLSWFTNASGIGEKKAKIEANASTSKTVAVTEGGFYIGTDSDNMKKYTQKFSKTYSDTNIPFSFDTSKYLTLTPGTKYFYKVYFVADGKTYISPVKNFTTKYAIIEGKPTDTLVHTNGVSITDIKNTSAKITLTEKFNRKVTVSEYGLYIGTTKDNLKKSSKVNKAKSANGSLTYTYNVSEYANLKRNTKYYIQTYIVADGKTYKSQVKNFTTSNKLTWPAIDRGLKNVTQGYHKGCIDIGGSKQTVVAAMGGTVYKYFLCNKSHVPKKQGGDGKGTNASCCAGFGNGLIIKGDDGRYYQYAHMYKNSIPKALRKKGAKVKEGQTIGKIGNTGYSFAAHLHFGISTTANFTKSKVDPMLEKYNGIDLDYFKKIAVSNIKKNDAKITANIVNTNVSKVGFYIGTSKTSMKKYTEKYSGKLTSFYYPLKKWCGSLKANTKYYYKFYIVANGKEIQSDIKSFTTSKK